MIAMTERQKTVLAYIRSFIGANGFAPTRREIADNFGWISSNAAQDVLMALHNKGHIEVRDGKSRAIRILSQEA